MTQRFTEQSGVVGVWGEAHAARVAWQGLHALQHRGPDGAGIAAADAGAIRALRGHGRVMDAVDGSDAVLPSGTAAIGHVRHGPSDDGPADLQPLVVRTGHGSMAIGHEGRLTNAEPLRRQLQEGGALFAGSSDAEIVLHLVASSRQETLVSSLVDALYRVEGAYSLVLLTESGLVGVRDPWGFRPLVLGRRENAWVLASETCALDALGAEVVRDVEPGEMLIIDDTGLQSIRPFPARPRRACSMEQLSLSRVDSRVFGLPAYQTRKTLGRLLAAARPVSADVVIPVPDSGVPGALGFAEASGLPFEIGLLRTVGFAPSVTQALTPVRSVLEGRRVVVIDDSLVRGNTAREAVRLVQMAGASEVHLRITAPPTTGPCFYGVDALDPEALLSHRMSVQEIRAFLGIDSLAYLPLDSLRDSQGSGNGSFCEACFTGDYPVLPAVSSTEAQVPLFGGPVSS